MKKFILSILSCAAIVYGSYAASVSIVVVPGTMTNALNVVNGSVKVTQIIVSASTNAAGQVYVYDNTTNTFWQQYGAYTNVISYATNLIGAPGSYWTNYFGVIQTNFMLTNVLVDVANSVPAGSNAVPIRFVGSAPAGSTIVSGGVNYYFNQGIWITNVSGSTMTVTLTYQQ